MVEHDYIMRLIKDLVRMALKVCFNVDTDSDILALFKDEQKSNVINELTDLINLGEINEAENRLFEITKSKDLSNLRDALLFYYYLNEKDDEFLEINNFTRNEIRAGLKDILSIYGLSGFTHIML